MQLNFIDILAAKLYDGFNLREKISEFEENYTNYKLNNEIIVRTISYIVSNAKNIDRAYILGNLTADHFAELWEVVCSWYRMTLDFLYQNNMLLSQSWIPYENMIIPMMVFLKEINGNFSQMTENQHKYLVYWYWASIFSQHYAGSSNEVIIQDSIILSTIAKDQKITDRNYLYKLRLQISSPEELHAYTKKGSAIYRGILNFVNFAAGGLIDWNNTSRLSFNHSKLEDHHIFPKHYLLSKFSKNEEIIALADSVVNKTLIPKITNIKIGQKPPHQYMNELLQKNPNLRNSLQNHLITPDLLDGYYDDDYLIFVQERAKVIYQLLQYNISQKSDEIRTQFYQESKVFMDFDRIKIFAIYYGQKVLAEYHPLNNQVLYEGKIYSPSAAGEKAKENISGEPHNTNGWEFWKFIGNYSGIPLDHRINTSVNGIRKYCFWGRTDRRQMRAAMLREP